MNDRELSELGKQLPWQRPATGRREAVRAALLDAATHDRRERARWPLVAAAFTAGALAAGAALWIATRHAERPADPVAIEASVAAEFERDVVTTARGVDEVVHVHAGTLRLAVGALATGRRLRVATRDAEVEGEGSYEVAVAADALRSVAVGRGRATLRRTGEAPVFLAAGQTWTAPSVAATIEIPRAPSPAAPPAPAAPAGLAPAAPVEGAPPAPGPGSAGRPALRASAGQPPLLPAPRPTEPRLVAPPASAVTRTPPPPAAPAAPAARPAAAPAVRVAPAAPASDALDDTPAPVPRVVAPAPAADASAIERHFQAGLGLLRAGKPAEAARELGAAVDAGGDQPLAADARYFQAVALTQAGRKTEAERALVGFLDHAPRSIRRGRAEVLLARLIAERGDAAAARAWFESVVHDPDPRIAAAAAAGLAALR